MDHDTEKRTGGVNEGGVQRTVSQSFMFTFSSKSTLESEHAYAAAVPVRWASGGVQHLFV